MTDNDDVFAGVLTRMTALADRFPSLRPDEALRGAVAGVAAQAMTIVVVGEIKKGKSSLINGLLGDTEASPTATDVATSVAFRFQHGQPAWTVHSYPEESGPPLPTAQIRRDEVAEYGTESCNPGNTRMVDCIAVSHPAPFLAQGFVLIDTPGLGGLYRNHSAVTWRHVPTADVVLFVVDSAEAVMSRQEVDYLQRIAKLGRPIFFVQTKRDLAETAQVAAWMKRNLAIISEALGKPASAIPYFCVSTALYRKAQGETNPAVRARLQQRSGYNELTAFLGERLLPASREQRKSAVAHELAARVTPVLDAAKDRVTMLTAASGGDLTRVEGDYAERKRELADWLATEAPQLRRRFINDISDFQRIASRELRERLATGAANASWGAATAKLDAMVVQGRTQRPAAQAFLEELRERCADATIEIVERFRNAAGGALGFMSDRQGDATDGTAERLPLEDASAIRDHAASAVDLTHDAPSAQAGQMVENVLSTVSLATGIGGMVGHVVFPGLGFVTGAVVMWWIASRKNRVAMDREAATWRSHMIEAAQGEMRTAMAMGQQVVEDISVTARRVGEEWLDRSAVRRRQESADLLESLAQERVRSRDGTKSAIDLAKKELLALQALSQQVTALLPGKSGQTKAKAS